MKICVFPGTFDPFTNGHLDVALRAAKIFDKVIIGVVKNPSKGVPVAAAERLRLIEKCLKGKAVNVDAEAFDGLLVDFCRKKGAKTILRGIRSNGDFEYEHAMSYVNKKLSGDIETLFILTNQELCHISSSIVRELIKLDADIGTFVPQEIKADLIKLYK